MAHLRQSVMVYAGTPPALAFTSPLGTPLIIDNTTDIAYYLNGSVVTPLAAAPGYAAPAFTAFSISGISTLEVGASYSNPTFNWSTSNSSNVAANSISITDTTLSTTLGTGLANSGSYAATASSVTRTTAGTHNYGISGTNSHSTAFTGSLAVPWLWRLDYGVNTNATLTAAQILALSNSTLTSTYAGTYAYAGGGFNYVCQSDSMGSQINSVKDQATGFAVPMATSADNAAYSNVDGGGFSYALVSVTNAQSVTSNYRVYRTKNSLGGAVTMLVT